jgi:hypothetical protein
MIKWKVQISFLCWKVLWHVPASATVICSICSRNSKLTSKLPSAELTLFKQTGKTVVSHLRVKYDCITEYECKCLYVEDLDPRVVK